MNNPEPAWSVGGEEDFVLEEDESFGVGEIARAEPPPFDAAPNLADEPLPSALPARIRLG